MEAWLSAPPGPASAGPGRPRRATRWRTRQEEPSTNFAFFFLSDLGRCSAAVNCDLYLIGVTQTRFSLPGVAGTKETGWGRLRAQNPSRFRTLLRTLHSRVSAARNVDVDESMP